MLRYIIVSLFIVYVNSFYMAVPEGHVGLYWVLGKLQPTLIRGLTFYLPLYSSVTLVKYVQDHDEAKDYNDISKLSCVSREGVKLTFDSVKIANKIDPNAVISVVKLYGESYDKVLVVRPIAQRLKELCANMTVDEIEITRFNELDDILKEYIHEQVKEFNITVEWVRISGIEIPTELRVKRLALATEKSQKLLIDEQAKNEKAKKEHELYLSLEDERKETNKAKAVAERLLIEADARLKEKEIDNRILIANAKAISEKNLLEYQNLKNLYSIQGYAEHQIALAISNNEKIYYGEKIPNFIVNTVPGKQ